MQTRYGIIILSQIEDTVTLYCNCIKYGYTKLRYSNNNKPDNITEILLSTAETVVTDLQPGDYTFYAVNTEGKFTLPVFINIPAVSQSQFLSNILAAADLSSDDCLQIIKKLKTKKYIEELYSLWLTREKDSPLDIYGESMLSALVSAYNLEQETLNRQFMFSFQITRETISTDDEIQYRFMPYEFNPTTQTWVLEKNNIKDGTSFVIHNNKSSVLRQISVLSDFNVVRKYFIYQPSKNVSETILEHQITKMQNMNEALRDLLTDVDLTELVHDEIGQKTVLSLSHSMPKYPLFKKPEIALNESDDITVTIPDYEAFALLEKNIYLAALELDEVFNEKPAPHKILISNRTITIRPSSFLINSDMNYIFYIMDDKGMILSDAVLFSLDDIFPVQEYTKSYMRIAQDKYARKLNTIFRTYRKQDWNKVSTLLNHFLLTDVSNIALEDYLMQQILRQYAREDRPDLWLQLVLLCRLSYYANVDQSFVQEQVYSKEFFSHILPEKPFPYLIRITRINEDESKDEYRLGGTESTSIRIDKDDFIFIQCIDPETWKVSSIAFYNNRIKDGARYYYFPNLKVEVI